MAPEVTLVSPYHRSGPATRAMMWQVLLCLTLTAVHFGVRYDPAYLWRYGVYLAGAALVEVLYRLLKEGALCRPHPSTLVTTALLVLSVPAHMPLLEVGSGILVALLFGKFMVDRKALRLNPMLLGRLWLMIVFADSIQVWLPPGQEIDAFTSATPLGLYAAEEAVYSPFSILLGSIGGDWEGIYAMLPSSPGEVMPLLSLVFGVYLYRAGVLDWRPGVACVLGFGATCLLLDMPLALHLVAGALLFTAVYVVTDPRSMPGSKAGRLVAGLLAGVLNAFIRNHGYYPEGIVLAVLAVNLLSPTLDRTAFWARGLWLARRQG